MKLLSPPEPCSIHTQKKQKGYLFLLNSLFRPARRSRPIPATDNASRIADAASISYTQFLWSACHALIFTRSWSRLPQNTGSRIRVCQYLCVHNMSHVSFVRVFLSGAARPCLAWKKAAATKISLFAYLWQLFFVRSYLNEFIRTLLSMCWTGRFSGWTFRRSSRRICQ